MGAKLSRLWHADILSAPPMACRHSQQGQATERRGTGPHTGTQADRNAGTPAAWVFASCVVYLASPATADEREARTYQLATAASFSENPGSASETGPHAGTHAPQNAENPRLLGGFAEAADGCRTRDLELGKLALYQLSYRRMMQGNPC